MATTSGDGFAVIDDFLPDDLHRSLLDWATHADYRPMNSTAPLATVWRQPDGTPYQAVEQHAVPAASPGPALPGNASPLQRFAAALNGHLPECTQLIGAGTIDWQSYIVCCFAYPRGTGLSLHADGAADYTGAFIYYLTPDWDPHWGGLLTLLHPATPLPAPDTATPSGHHRRNWFATSDGTERMLSPGIATTVFPKANRLVLVRADVQHFITRVDAAAGDRVRMALSGFFSR